MVKIITKLCKKRLRRAVNIKRANRAMRQYKGRNQAIRRTFLKSIILIQTTRYKALHTQNLEALKQALLRKVTSPIYLQQ